MTKRHRVLWYTLDGDITRAEQILQDLGHADDIELVSCAHEPFCPMTPEQVAGCEAVAGEFAPVVKDTVDVVADAGVRIIASMSIGLNHMDVAGLAARGVLTSNCPGYCAEDVATHAMALTLDLLRKVTLSNRDVRAGGWDPKVGYAVHRPSTLTMGLVFLGNIARAVIPMAQGMGMRVVVWAPTKTDEQIRELGCEPAATLDDLLRASDVVSLHCPLIPQTTGLIGKHELSLMGPESFLINTARGPIVDEDALVAALDAGTIQGAGLDVLADEVKDRNQRLIEHPRCIVTPHTAYDSIEAADALRRMSLEAICQLLCEGKTPEYVVSA